MTTLLRRAVAEAEKLPVEDQDAIASRLLAEEVRREITTGGTRPLDESFPRHEPQA